MYGTQTAEEMYLLPHSLCCPSLLVFLSPCNVPLDPPSLWSSCSGWCSSCSWTNKKWKLNLTSYYFPVRLSNFISHPGGRGALSLLSLISLRTRGGTRLPNQLLVSFFPGSGRWHPIAGFSGRPHQKRSILSTSPAQPLTMRRRHLTPMTTFKTNNNI